MNELVQYVCEKRPLLVRLVGRERVAEVIAATVASWPGAALAACDKAGDRELGRATLSELRCHVIKEKRYGNPLLILWGISLIINLVWQWWLSRQQNREKMACWQKAMEGGS